MDNHARIMKLENKKLALQKEINDLKKTNGQLDLEEFLNNNLHSQSFSSDGNSTMDFGFMSIKIRSCKPFNEYYYKDMLTALKSLFKVCGLDEFGNTVIKEN